MGKKKWMMSTGGRTKSNGQERKMSGRTIYVQLAREEEICPMDKRGKKYVQWAREEENNYVQWARKEGLCLSSYTRTSACLCINITRHYTIWYINNTLHIHNISHKHNTPYKYNTPYKHKHNYNIYTEHVTKTNIFTTHQTYTKHQIYSTCHICTTHMYTQQTKLVSIC